MDFIDRLREIAVRIPKLKQDGIIKTEEGTKNALVMPFINALGYNVFDPTEVTPELTADFGTKKGEKVDYAILRDTKPIILFECKAFNADLKSVHASQLYRYFSVTSVRFGVLTNGVEYRFFSDLIKPNTMDENPFFVFSLDELKESAVEELKKFTKAAFDEQSILTAASELKIKNLIRDYLTKQITDPSEDLIRVLMTGSSAYTGRFTQSVTDTFRNVVRDALRSFLNEQIENRLKSALANESAARKAETDTVEATPTISRAPTSTIVTTAEELEAYLVIKAILREVVDVKRITLRDAQSYCAVLLDDNNRRPIARLYFGSKSKSIGIFDLHKVEQKLSVAVIDDLFLYASQLREAVMRYIGES